MNRLAVGIAGCGLIAGGPVREGRPLRGNHAQACRDLADLDLVAAADPDVVRREEFGSFWGVRALFADVPTMLAETPIDILIVATTPDAHESACLAAAQAGVRGVLCEKPLTGTADGAERVVTALARRGIALVANFSRRWDASHAELRRRIGDGAIGAVRTVHGVYTGSLRGNGSHLVDTIEMLAPADWRVDWATGLESGLADGPVDATFGAPDGARASIQCVRGAEYFVFELHLLGTRGRARLLAQGNAIHIDAPQPDADYPGYRYLQPVEHLPPNTMPASFARALAALADAVRHGRTPPVDPASYVSSLRLLEQLAERAHLPAPA